MNEMLMVEVFRSRHEELVRDAAIERQRHGARFANGAERKGGGGRGRRFFRRAHAPPARTHA